jgi:hypothetical protein
MLQVPSPAGLELLVKLVIPMLLAAAAMAAKSPFPSAGRSSDVRAIVLAAGVAVTGLTSSVATYLYLRPTAEEIAAVRLSSGDGHRTSFAAEVEHRPDVYGLFSLDSASASPRLEFLRTKETPPHLWIEKVVGSRWGTARLEPRPQPARDWSELRPAPPEDSTGEVWLRWRGWPRVDLRTGIRMSEPVADWSVSPDGAFAVASTYIRSPGILPTFHADRLDRGTYAVDLWRGNSAPRRLVDDLPLPPRILVLTQRSVTLLVHGQSYSRGRLKTAGVLPTQRRDGVRTVAQASADGFVRATSYAPTPLLSAVTRCDLVSLKCEPWRVESGERSAIRPEAFRRELDSSTLKAFLPLPPCPGCASDSDRPYLLSDGRVVRIALLGSVPDWDARLWAYDVEGRETASTSLGNVRMTRFAGELSGDEIAFIWRARYGRSVLSEPVGGWTLEAWNTSTGQRRRLAEEIATFPSVDDDASTIFLDREGRLVVPAIDGVRVLAQLGYPLPIP